MLGLYNAGTAHARLQGGMSSFLSDMSYANNTTLAKAWQGQITHYVSGGSFYARTGNKNIQLVPISLPSINTGCGGTDVYLGVFSFTDSDQIMTFVKQTMTNAMDYFFGSALETTVPELRAAKDSLQKMIADINRFNMSSCQAAKAIVDSVASLRGESQQNVYQSVGGQRSIFSDWVVSRQGCTSGGKYSSVVDRATGTEKNQVLKSINPMWDALGNSSLNSNAELRQLATSISSSVVFGSNDGLRVLPSMTSDRSLSIAMISGGIAEVYVYNNQNKCLPPILNNVTIPADKSLIKVMQDIPAGIGSEAITDTPLTEKERQFINSTSIPILSWTMGQPSLNVPQSLFAQPTDYIAANIYLQYLEAMMRVANGSLATRDCPGVNMKELENGPSDVRQALNSLRMEVQIREDALISVQQQIRLVCQQVSLKTSDHVLGNYQFNRAN